MKEKKKRKAVYNPEADKKYRASLTKEQKAENNRRSSFTRARNFIRDKKYTSEEFVELYELIIERHANENKDEL